MHQALDRPSAALDVHQDRSRHLVPVPRVVPVVLVKRAQLACVGVQRDHRGRVEIVAGALIAHPLRPVAGAPVREIELGIEAARDPDGRATRLPRIALPGLGARLARRRYRERLPGRRARAGIQRLDETADPELTARDADHDFPLGHQGRQRHVITLLVVLHRPVPEQFAGLRVQRDDVGVERGEIDLVLVEADPAVRRVQLKEIVGQLALVPPQELAGLGVEGEHLVLRRAHEHDAVVHDGWRLVAFGHARREAPDRHEVLHVAGVDLLERAVAPGVIGSPVHQPVLGLGTHEPLIGHRCVAGGAGGGARARRRLRHADGARPHALCRAPAQQRCWHRRRDQKTSDSDECSRGCHRRSPPTCGEG